jgi:class I fructose-bisphosphate aldolase
MGPLPGLTDVHETLGKIVAGGCDAVILTPGHVKSCASFFRGRESPSLILRLDWTNMFRGTLPRLAGAHTLIASVNDAIRFGATAVITYLFVGYETDELESVNISNVAGIAMEAVRLGIPYIIEAMGRGPRVQKRETDPEIVKLAVRMAGEMGADIVKTDYTGSIESFKEVVDSSPVPVMIAGGAKTQTPRQALEIVSEAIQAGAAGVFVGRNVFQVLNPTAMVQALWLIVHKKVNVDEALELMKNDLADINTPAHNLSDSL